MRTPIAKQVTNTTTSDIASLLGQSCATSNLYGVRAAGTRYEGRSTSFCADAERLQQRGYSNEGSMRFSSASAHVVPHPIVTRIGISRRGER